MVVDDGELDAEVARSMQSGWKTWKKVPGLLTDRRMNGKIMGDVYASDSGKPSAGAQADTGATKTRGNKFELIEM